MQASVTTSDGAALRLERTPARPDLGARRGVVLCLHAMMADGGYFRRFASALAEDGYDVVVGSFRGRPYTRGDDWTFDDLVDFDLPALATGAAKACGVTIGEVTIVGHSLGGLVASAGLATGRIPRPRSLALVAACVWRGETWRRRALMATYLRAAKAFGRAPIRLLRLGNADEAKSYVAQLASWSRTGRWTSTRGVDYLAALSSIDAPVRSCASVRDWMCTPRDAAEIAGRIPSALPMRLVGRAHGDAVDPDHFGLVTRTELLPLWRWLVC